MEDFEFTIKGDEVIKTEPLIMDGNIPLIIDPNKKENWDKWFKEEQRKAFKAGEDYFFESAVSNGLDFEDWYKENHK